MPKYGKTKNCRNHVNFLTQNININTMILSTVKLFEKEIFYEPISNCD